MIDKANTEDKAKIRAKVFYKERWIKENDLEQKLIVTYSIKYRDSHAGLSRSYFAVAFKSEVGCSPLEYLADLRLQNAKRILANSKLSIADVAHSVGFHDALYFSKFFSKFEKTSPSEYRNNLKSV